MTGGVYILVGKNININMFVYCLIYNQEVMNSMKKIYSRKDFEQ